MICLFSIIFVHVNENTNYKLINIIVVPSKEKKANNFNESDLGLTTEEWQCIICDGRFACKGLYSALHRALHNINAHCLYFIFGFSVLEF